MISVKKMLLKQYRLFVVAVVVVVVGSHSHFIETPGIPVPHLYFRCFGTFADDNMDMKRFLHSFSNILRIEFV